MRIQNDGNERTSVQSYEIQLVKDRAVSVLSDECDNPAKIAAVLKEYLGSPTKEHFVVALLNSRQKVVGLSTISVGTLTASLVHPREVFQPAILLSAATIIIAHNHPSFDPTPSPEDKETTRRMIEAGKLLGIPVSDHIILGGETFYSFMEHGLL